MRRDVAFVTLNPIRNFPEDKDIWQLRSGRLRRATRPFHQGIADEAGHEGAVNLILS